MTSGRASRSGHRRRAGGMPPWVPVAGIGAVAILIVVAIIVASSVLNGDSDVDIPERTIPSEGRTLGYPDAPVTMVEYSDFQCPYCARAAATTTPQIEEEYVADGRVKLMHHYMAFEGPESVLAAEAAECANDQGRFWEYRDTLFENQIQYSVEDLRGFAEDVGLDMATFNQCLDSGEHEQLVIDETQEAFDIGINSTPTFIIGDQAVTGAYPFEVFQQVIEEELSKNQ
jgi:protein-disulfide isomerase